MEDSPLASASASIDSSIFRSHSSFVSPRVSGSGEKAASLAEALEQRRFAVISASILPCKEDEFEVTAGPYVKELGWAFQHASDPDGGIFVTGVKPSSWAAVSGLREGDKLLYVGRRSMLTNPPSPEILEEL